MLIYKILRPSEWDRFEASGTFAGSPDDERDGFIHCSTRSQLPATALRFFADDPSLVVLALEEAHLSAWIRWEPGGSGDLYPHIYRTIARDAVAAVHHVEGAAAIDAQVPE